MRLASALLLGCLFPLVACDLAPPYQPPLIAAPDSYREMAGTWQPAAPGTLQTDRWWELFNDPVIDGLEQQLDAQNPDLEAQLAVYQQARAAAEVAEAGLFPQLGSFAGVSGNRQSRTRPLRPHGGTATTPNWYGNQIIGGLATYELDIWDQVHNAVVSGRALEVASAGTLAAVRLSLQSELASDYFALRGLDSQARLLDTTVAAYKRALDLTQDRFRGKISSDLDVSRAETQLDSARTQVSDIAARREALQDAIAALTGQAAPNFALPPMPLSGRLPDSPAGLPSTLLERRPDIVAAEQQVKAANALIGVARAAFYPTITISAAGGVNSTGLNMLNLPDSFWSVGPSLLFPIFEGGLRHAEEEAAWARLHQSVASYRANVLGAFQEVQDVLSAIRWGRQELADAITAAAAAQRTLDMATILYTDGAYSYLEVVVAQTAPLQEQQTVIDMQTRLAQQAVALVQAVGGGWTRTDLDTPLPDVIQAVQ